MQEFQVGFEHDVGFRRTRGWVPQDWVVVGEEGEEDAEGKTCSWPARSALSGDGGLLVSVDGTYGRGS